MINEQDYIKTEKDDGTIIFTPKRKEMTVERSRLKGEKYYRIGSRGDIFTDRDEGIIGGSDDSIFEYGNYYSTKEQAQAVVDLRRHVYKFPPTTPGRMVTFIEINNISDCELDSTGISSYLSMVMPTSASLIDKQERQRLIKRCYELNGYVSI